MEQATNKKKEKIRTHRYYYCTAKYIKKNIHIKSYIVTAS